MSATCECASCGRIFGSLTGFDCHQNWDYKRTPKLICREPAELGMMQDERGRWRMPQNAAGAERLRNLRAQRTAALGECTP